jgi:CBS-domain-containing membrane protein
MGGLWFMLIGLFLFQAARSSYELVRIRARLEVVRVADVMNTAPAVLDTVRPEDAVSPRDSAWQAFLRIVRNGTGRVAVVDGGALVGVVTQRDLQHVVARARAADTVSARRAA